MMSGVGGAAEGAVAVRAGVGPAVFAVAVLTDRDAMAVAALVGLAERADEADAAQVAGVVDGGVVIAAVEDDGLGLEAAVFEQVEQRIDLSMLWLGGRPGGRHKRELRLGADRGVWLVAVEAATGAGRDCASVSPCRRDRRIAVAVALPAARASGHSHGRPDRWSQPPRPFGSQGFASVALPAPLP